MSEIDQFIDEYNRLVIGDERCSYFSLVEGHNDRKWRTWGAPLEEPERVGAAISGIASSLATGSHVLILQAVNATGGIMGQVSVAVDGRSGAAKRANNDQLATVKGSQMIVETAEQQINLAMARADMAERRAQDLQNQINEQAGAQMSLVETCSKMLMDQERAQLEEEERRGRIEALQQVAMAFAPIANAMAEMGVEHFQHKRDKMKAEQEADRANWKTNKKQNGEGEKPEPSTEKPAPVEAGAN